MLLQLPQVRVTTHTISRKNVASEFVVETGSLFVVNTGCAWFPFNEMVVIVRSVRYFPADFTCCELARYVDVWFEAQNSEF